MSLRLRLSLIISALFLLGLIAGAGFQLASARQRVSQEVDSAVVLTAQLLDVLLKNLAPDQAPSAGVQLVATISRVVSRDLDLSIVEASASMPVPGQIPVKEVPDWFVWLVQPALLQYSFEVPGTDQQRLILQANPEAEIREVWNESLNFILALLLVLMMINGLLFWIVGRWFAPVNAIVAGLEEAGQGQFTAQLPEAGLPELQLITARFNQLARSLEVSQSDNDRLRQKALQIQEDEQRHLARELHDELGQSITAIKAIAFSLAQHAQESDPVSLQGARSISSISSEVSQRLRLLMGRLRPVALEELGLVPALQGMVDEWNGIHREQFCSLHCEGSFNALDGRQQIHLYRVVQEALTNAARHSEADTITVRLEHANACYSLDIQDNGKGFDQTLTPRGMGLTGLKERAQALGAQYVLQSAPGQGLRITLRFPQEVSHAIH